MKKIFSFILLTLILFYGNDCLAAEEIQIQLTGHEARLTYQVLDDGRLLISAKNTENNPIRGLKAEDFVVQQGIKKAKILSAEPLETTEDVPLNIVLVIDNSFSMKQRRAVKPLLAALNEFLKTVRPIDNIHFVVFSDEISAQVKKYDLHAKSFHSSNTAQLREFLIESFDDGQTSKTYLYEAMVAGIDIIRSMPEKDQKFLVVFSDGEDLNSDLEKNVVESESLGISNFEAF
jgi:hypothetical protein